MASGCWSRIGDQLRPRLVGAEARAGGVGAGFLGEGSGLLARPVDGGWQQDDGVTRPSGGVVEERSGPDHVDAGVPCSPSAPRRSPERDQVVAPSAPLSSPGCSWAVQLVGARRTDGVDGRSRASRSRPTPRGRSGEETMFTSYDALVSERITRRRTDPFQGSCPRRSGQDPRQQGRRQLGRSRQSPSRWPRRRVRAQRRSSSAQHRGDGPGGRLQWPRPPASRLSTPGGPSQSCPAPHAWVRQPPAVRPRFGASLVALTNTRSRPRECGPAAMLGNLMG